MSIAFILNVFGVVLTRYVSTVNDSVNALLSVASTFISTPEAVDANIGVISRRWLSE